MMKRHLLSRHHSTRWRNFADQKKVLTFIFNIKNQSNMDILVAIKTAKSAANIIGLLKNAIRDIQAEIAATHLNIANAHLDAAKDALKSVEITNETIFALRETLTHLRAAYFVYQSAIDSKVEVTHLFFLTKMVDSLNDEKKVLAYAGQLEVGMLIAYILHELGDINNKNSWKSKLKGVVADYYNCKFKLLRISDIVEDRGVQKRLFTSDEEKSMLNVFRQNKIVYYRTINIGQYRTNNIYNETPEGKKLIDSFKSKQIIVVQEEIEKI